MPTITDFLLGSTAGVTGPVSGVWVRLQNNSTLATFVANAATDALGTFTVANVPPGTYTVATGPTSLGPFTVTTDANYFIGADVGAATNTFTGALTVQGALTGQSTVTSQGTLTGQGAVTAVGALTAQNTLTAQGIVSTTTDVQVGGNTLMHGGGPWFDVKHPTFGAKGDGATDDTNAIQAALNACRTAGGGIVYMPPGTYIISTSVKTGGSFNWAAGILVGPKTWLRGAGRDATTLKLVANASGVTGTGSPNVAMITPWDASQEQMTLSDFTLDGNGGNQTDAMSATFILRARGAHFARLRTLNVWQGTGGGPQQHFQSNGGADHTYIDCTAIQTIAGSISAGGFTADAMTNVRYIGCSAIGIGNSAANTGIGFNVTDGSAQIQYDHCEAYLIGQECFHIDASNVRDVTYTACIAGGVAATSGSTLYPFTSAQSLGGKFGFENVPGGTNIRYIGCVAVSNSSNGFECRAGTSIEYHGCVSRSNGGAGLSANTGTQTVRVIGGDFSANNVGIHIDAATAPTVRITGGPVIAGNTTAQLQVGATNYSAPPANVAAPGVPATTVALTNPFGFDADVGVTPGASTCAVAIDGTASGVTLASSGVGQMFSVPAGATITLTYTSAPTWVWFLK